MFTIGTHTIGSGRCFVIGEVAQAHGGRLEIAHAFIDAIADAGADAVKFQTHIADAESTPSEPFRTAGPWPAKSRYEYWKLMEFQESEWHSLAGHARARGLAFMSSPFSAEAADLLQRIGVPAWKVASGELTNRPLLEHLAASGLPALLSTGLARWAEIDAAVDLFKRRGVPVAVLQATSIYPCPPSKVGLGVMDAFRQRYGCPAGLSDHSGDSAIGLAAAAVGADLLEVHVLIDEQTGGPDADASLTAAQLADLVRGLRVVEAARGSLDKDAMAEELAPMRRMFFKSVVAAQDLEAGTTLTRRHLSAKKPGTGISAADIDAVVGHRLRRRLTRDELLQWSDVEALADAPEGHA